MDNMYFVVADTYVGNELILCVNNSNRMVTFVNVEAAKELVEDKEMFTVILFNTPEDANNFMEELMETDPTLHELISSFTVAKVDKEKIEPRRLH